MGHEGEMKEGRWCDKGTVRQARWRNGKCRRWHDSDRVLLVPSPASELLSHKRWGRTRGTELVVEEPPRSLNSPKYSNYCWSCQQRTCRWNDTSFTAHVVTRHRGYSKIYQHLYRVESNACVNESRGLWMRYLPEQSCRRNETTSRRMSVKAPHPQAFVFVLHRDLDKTYMTLPAGYITLVDLW